jgi:type II secretory pathway component PulM
MKNLIQLLQQARTAWNARAPREQMLIAAMAAVVLVAILWSLSDWTRAERTRLARVLPATQAQLGAMRDDAAELQRLQRQPARTPPAAGAAAATLESSAKARGFKMDVKASQDSIKLTGSGDFDGVIQWLAEMQRDSSLRITRLTATRAAGLAQIEAELTIGEH